MLTSFMPAENAQDDRTELSIHGAGNLHIYNNIYISITRIFSIVYCFITNR